MPLTLKVAIRIRGRRLPVIRSSWYQHDFHPARLVCKLRSIQVYRDLDPCTTLRHSPASADGSLRAKERQAVFDGRYIARHRSDDQWA